LRNISGDFFGKKWRRNVVKIVTGAGGNRTHAPYNAYYYQGYFYYQMPEETATILVIQGIHSNIVTPGEGGDCTNPRYKQWPSGTAGGPMHIVDVEPLQNWDGLFRFCNKPEQILGENWGGLFRFCNKPEQILGENWDGLFRFCNKPEQILGEQFKTQHSALVYY
jgi:hypothetical protein